MESLSANHQETARRPKGWPSDKPVWSLTVFFLAALVVPGRIVLEYAQHWSGLGAHYLPHYVMSAVGPAGSYWILNMVTRRGVHLTTSGEVQAVPVAGSRYNVRQMPFRLTPAAIARGAEALQWRRIDADNQKLHAFFRTRIYGARPLPELAKQGAIWAGLFLVIGPDRLGRSEFRRTIERRFRIDGTSKIPEAEASQGGSAMGHLLLG